MKTVESKPNIDTIQFDDWNEFLTFSTKQLDYRHFIWRGQREGTWPLEPTLDRIIRLSKRTDYIGETNRHLNFFRFAIRGRGGQNNIALTAENELWALGQHHGLATPLLDWTASPFVAAFFAFASDKPSSTNCRLIFGLSQKTIEWKSEKIKAKYTGKDRPPIIEFIEPLTNDNARLVNQNGLFTRAPAGIHIEKWVADNLPDEGRIRLWKICLPESERITILRSLNRMNVNYLTLFPDLEGSSKHSNLELLIDKY